MSDNFDIDAILSSATKKSEPKQDAKEAEPTDYSFVPNNEGTNFRIDPRSAHITGTDDLRRDSNSVTVNPEDFSNQVDIAAQSKRTRKLLIGMMLVAVVLGLGYAAYTFIPVSSGGTLEQPRPPMGNTNEAVLEQFFPNAPVPPTDAVVTVEATETGLWMTTGTEKTYRLTFAGMDFQATDRRIVANDEFGLVATANVPGDWNGTQVYAFKDMVRSPVFSQGWERALLEVEGSPVAAVMYLELATRVHAVVAVVNPDSTGYMIVLPQNLNYASAENLADFLRVE